jgi:hypothetical protein
VTNTPTLKRSFVETFIAPASSLAEVFFGLIMVLTFTLGAGLADITTADERSRFYRSILALAGRRP